MLSESLKINFGDNLLTIYHTANIYQIPIKNQLCDVNIPDVV